MTDQHDNVTGMPPAGIPGARTVPGAVFTAFVRQRDELNRKRMLAGRSAFTDMAAVDLLRLAQSTLMARSTHEVTYEHIETVGAYVVAAAQAKLREDELRVDLGDDLGGDAA